MSGQRRRRAAREEEEDDEEEQTLPPTVTTTTSSKRQRSAASSPALPDASALPIRYSSLTALKMDRANVTPLVGARIAPPQYVCSAKANLIASKFPGNEMRAALSSATRLLLGFQFSGKQVDGKQIMEMAKTRLNGPDAKNRHLLGYIRARVANRLKDVFGFALFAGDHAVECKTSDKWFFVNALENDELKRLALPSAATSWDRQAAGEDDDDAEEGESGGGGVPASTLDRNRGILMIVLSVVMVNHLEVSEATMGKDLEKFGFSTETVSKAKKLGSSAPSIPDVLTKLTKQGFLARTKKDGMTHYVMGEKALKEVGQRTVLQFIVQTLRVDLAEEEEAWLLGLQDA